MSSLKLTVEQGSEVVLEVVEKDTSVSQYIKAKLASLEITEVSWHKAGILFLIMLVENLLKYI